jgi:hypothetical protein
VSVAAAMIARSTQAFAEAIADGDLDLAEQWAEAAFVAARCASEELFDGS